MNPRTVAPVITCALGLVVLVGGSSPAAHPQAGARDLDLLASAHPSVARPAVSDTAYAATWARGRTIEADTAALTSTTCDDCVGESSSLHVVYVPRARHAGLDNVATAWAQQCRACTSTALSLQVVVLGGRPTVVPNNRALSLTAACDGCRTSALAFQVVLVGDRADPLGPDEMAGLRAWFDEQAAALRASVATPLPDPATTTPTPSPTPAEPTQAPTTLPPPSSDGPAAARALPGKRALRREAASALDQLEALLTSALPAEVVSADVTLSQ